MATWIVQEHPSDAGPSDLRSYPVERETATTYVCKLGKINKEKKRLVGASTRYSRTTIHVLSEEEHSAMLTNNAKAWAQKKGELLARLETLGVRRAVSLLHHALRLVR